MPIIVHCQSGGRSKVAARLLDANGYGYAHVFNMLGGKNTWLAMGWGTVPCDIP